MSKETKKTKKSKIADVISYLLTAIVVAVSSCVIFYKTYFEHIYVSGQSMLPTINNPETIESGWVEYGFINPGKRAINSIERFDIIATYYPWDSKDYAQPFDKGQEINGSNPEGKIKRVIALPGETLQITDGIYYINGQEVSHERFNYKTTYAISTYNIGPITLGEDRYFVMGDNWSNSNDCASPSNINYGGIYKENIIGKLVALEGVCQVEEGNAINKHRTGIRWGSKI